MDKIQLIKKERDESYRIFWYRFSNLNNAFPTLLSLILIGTTYCYLINQASQKEKAFSLIVSLLSGISVKWFTDTITKIKEEHKIKERAISSVRQLDSLHLALVKSVNYNTAEMKHIEEGIILAIESWNDILPELKYRDRTKIIQEIDKQVKDLNETQNKNISQAEYDEKITSIKKEIIETEYLGLNFTGDTREFKLLNYNDFIRQQKI